MKVHVHVETVVVNKDSTKIAQNVRKSSMFKSQLKSAKFGSNG